MLEVKFYDNVADELLKFAVIISKAEDKWVFCKHKERDTCHAMVGSEKAYSFLVSNGFESEYAEKSKTLN